MPKATLKDFYKLAKPGIIYGNVFTTIAAFFFASPWRSGQVSSIQISMLFLATVVGISFVIGSACVFNNYLDRDLDRNMERTANRALVTGLISVRSALVYASLLGIIGFVLLFACVNLLTAAIALFGFLMYVVVYGYAKRTSHWGAVVGSIPGAVPIVVGYTAVTNHLDAAALILFLILALWQMPHFYGIAMYRLEEYKAAGIPVFPAKKGAQATKVHMLWYIVAYIILTSLLAPFFSDGLSRYFYVASIAVFGIRWLMLAIKGFKMKPEEDAKWAKKVFLFSLIVLVSFSVTIALAPLLT